MALVYVTDIEYQADIKVFAVNEKYQADLCFFEVDRDYKANTESKWFSWADYSLRRIFGSSPNMTIIYLSFPWFFSFLSLSALSRQSRDPRDKPEDDRGRKRPNMTEEETSPNMTGEKRVRG